MVQRLLPIFCLIPLVCLVSLSADIIDRIAISAGNQVITESQIDEEVRVTQFLNVEKLDLSAGEKKKAAGRLIEQALVKREMELNRYPLPPLSDADKQLELLKAGYASEAQFQDALRTDGIAEDALRRRLWWQLTLLRFIEFRFRPGIQIQDSDVQEYYKQQVAKWRNERLKSIPSFEEERVQIEEILTQQHVDEAMDRWLSEVRMQVSIRYRDESLQ
jgi:peptidyl-prolyl cis-trans isomerase SurA